MRPGGIPSPVQREILVRKMHADGEVAWAPVRVCLRQQGGVNGAKAIRNA